MKIATAPSPGQLLVVGFEGTSLLPETRQLLTLVQPAGVILFARNLVNAQQAHGLLRDCQSCVRSPLLTMIDLEGGRVDRLRSVIGPTPSAADVFATGDVRLYRRHGLVIGRNCRALGFNVDLAPVLDLAFPASRAVMSSRSFSTDPKQVVAYARAFLAGLESAGVLGCGKHFPGLGEGSLDSHQHLPRIKKTFARLWTEDIATYRAMKRDLAMALVNHANYRQVTRNRLPASLSKHWVTAVLRRKIGFRGLILSDDLEMEGVLKAAPIERAAMEFVRAGGDLCLICHRQEGIEKSFQALERAFDRDPAFRRRASESIKRIAVFKRRHASLLKIGLAPSEEKTARLSRQLWEFSEQVRLARLAPGEPT
jgi:beta-N-acetylhexosaminidase